MSININDFIIWNYLVYMPRELFSINLVKQKFPDYLNAFFSQIIANHLTSGWPNTSLTSDV